MPVKHDPLRVIPWKSYLTVAAETLIAFYLATFSLGLFFKSKGDNWLAPGIFLGLLYIFVIVVCARRLFQTLPLATMMLLIPIAPFIALILIISLIPVLQKF